METFVYNGSSDDIEKALDLHRQGVKIVCWKCNSELIVISDSDTTAKYKYKKHPGIYCPVNEKHVMVVFLYSRSQFWEEVQKLREERIKREKMESTGDSVN